MLVKIGDCYIDPNEIRAVAPDGASTKILFKNLPNHIIIYKSVDEVARLINESA